ncbi:hypothetical protein GCM10020331_082570 [Ectobacillus funiculus]
MLYLFKKNDNTHVIVDIIINSDNLAELLERMQAVSTLLNADQDILQIQQKKTLSKLNMIKKLLSKKRGTS